MRGSLRRSRYGFALRASLSIALLLSLLVGFSNSANAAPSRSLVDRSDDLKGPQIHLVYVVPNDARDLEWDTSGQYKRWVDRAQEWLASEIGKTLKFDTYNGELDISFLRSKLTTQDMITRSTTSNSNVDGVLHTLIKEFLEQSPQRDYKTSPKTYMFMISENIKPEACGYAQLSSVFALGFTGGNCWQGPQDDVRSGGVIPWPSTTIVHEVFHTYGVEHTCDDVQDLMWGSGCTGKRTSNLLFIDKDNNEYFGGDKAGVDISKLPIWSDSPTSNIYASIKPKAANAPKLTNGDFVFEVGKSAQSISWEWERIGYSNLGGFTECTLSSGAATIATSVNGGPCLFDIPLTWRGGQIAVAKSKIWVGPFFGESSTLIKIWNPDKGFSACTEAFCFEKEVLSIDSSYCYPTDYKFFTLEQFVGEAWKPVVVMDSRPTERCKGTNWEPTPAEVEFSEAGAFVYRWVGGDSTISRKFTEPAQVINVLKSDAPYPTGNSKESQIVSGKSVLDEVQAKTLRESLCNSGKSCFVGEKLTVPSLCYGSDIGSMELEILKDTKWQVIFSGPTKKGENNCGEFFSTPTYTLTIDLPGVQSFRWRAASSSKYQVLSNKLDVKIDVVPPSKNGINLLTTTKYASTKLSTISESVIRSRAEAAAKAKAEEEARLKAEAEAAAKAKAEEEARLKAEAEAAAKAKAEEEARLKAEAKLAAEAAAKAAAKKSRVTITCVKGKVVKKVTAKNPKCPAGYKKK